MAFGIALATPEEIDALNILRASCSPCGGRWKRFSPPPTSSSSTGTSRFRAACRRKRLSAGRPVRLDRGRVDPREGVAGPDDGGVRPALPGVRPRRAQGVSDAGASGGDPPPGADPDPPEDVPRGRRVIAPPEARRAQGAAAEERACRHLERAGFAIAERNFRTRGGEIDIVARKGICSSSWRSARARPTISVRRGVGHPAKRRRIVAAARRYLTNVPASSWREAGST